MTVREEVKNLLEANPKARERRNSAKAAIFLLRRRFPQFDETPTELLINFCTEYESLKREWRWVTAHHSELRGRDYDDKIDLETAKRAELSYPKQKILPEQMNISLNLNV